MMTRQIRSFASADAMAEAACRQILALAEQAIAERGRFVMALAGGNTPAGLYRRLAASAADFSRWQLVYGDERFLPAGDNERNSTLVSECWLQAVNFPAENHHALPAADTVQQAAAAYSRQVAALLPLDLALLGIGEDGHCASLFPGHACCQDVACAVTNAAKPPAQRVTLSEASLNSAAQVIFLVSGRQKKAVVMQGLAGADVPFTHIHGRRHTWLLADFNLENHDENPA